MPRKFTSSHRKKSAAPQSIPAAAPAAPKITLVRVAIGVIASLFVVSFALMAFGTGGGRKTPTVASAKPVSSDTTNGSRRHTAEYRALEERFFPKDGYAEYTSAFEVPWEKVLRPTSGWSHEEEKGVKLALDFIVAALGEEDPVTKAIKHAGRPDSPFDRVVPLEKPLAFKPGQGEQESVLAMWSHQTKCVHLSRTAKDVTIRAVLIAREIRIGVAMAKADDGPMARFKREQECRAWMKELFAKLRTVCEKQKEKDRLLLELEVLQDAHIDSGLVGG